MASSCAPERRSRQMKGVLWGTAGGAQPPFVPTVTAWMPWPIRTGTALRENPSTSRCAPRHALLRQHACKQREILQC